MEVTEEQLDRLIEKKLNERRNHASPAVLEFKEEIKNWAKEQSNNTQVSYSAALNTINGVIRMKLKNIRSMSGLSDSDLPVAKQAMKELRQLLE
ncbi:hypothetical protein FHQ08_11925 [Lactobacillus sp. CC-MHH1034]|uniref:hypothetical protein n=1 Tax=Agrilactobacillus fermenti TaxID=2586909 RepID=UPI001E3882F9|nr:hypothetical protein [Agrilactobacillus fermenti]MCD2257394.1 hypothetical protein [Agrilactobacillus fermenti]